MKNIKKKPGIEKRIKSRKSYSGHIFFTAKTGLYEGRLKNYSRHGLFIETMAYLAQSAQMISHRATAPTGSP